MPYRVEFGRSDQSAQKYADFRSRIRALMFANSIAYVLFYQHPFRSSECRDTVRIELNGFYVKFSEKKESDNDNRNDKPASHHQ